MHPYTLWMHDQGLLALPDNWTFDHFVQMWSFLVKKKNPNMAAAKQINI